MFSVVLDGVLASVLMRGLLGLLNVCDLHVGLYVKYEDTI